MVQVTIKRVYEPEEATDGFRVLVDKLWPRGIKKGNLPYDLWAKDIALSTPLREWYHEDMEGRWQEFERKYTEELKNSPAMNDFISQIKGQKTVTLLYASHNAAENHALILRDYIQKHI
jgi:uncharacterized protein YeaO (DUF488 family)